MRPHPARRETGAAAPAAQHSQPGGRPRLTFKHCSCRSTSPEAAGRFAHIVKCARILRPVSWAPQPHPHFIRGPRGRLRLSFEFLAGPHGCGPAWCSVGYNPSGMLVGIGCAIAVAIIRSYKTRSKQNRNRMFRDYVRRTY
jgi:hypothetical protein